MKVDLYFDVVCPYAWMGALRMRALEAKGECEIVWRPILLGGVFRALGQPDVPMDVMPASKIAHLEADLQRNARVQGVQLAYPPDHPRRTVGAMRALLAVPANRRGELALVLWDAYWTKGIPLQEPEALARVIQPFGITLADVEAQRDALREATQEAVDRGVFGVPSLFVGEQMFWGADRVQAVRSALGQLPDPALPTGPVEVFHDFASPYSYIGVQRALASGVDLTLTPILLGALFQAIGTPIVPIAVAHPRKAEWYRRDMVEQAALWGIDFTMTPHFPLRTVLPLRVAILEPAATLPLYQAAWVDGIDIGRPEEVAGVLERANLPGRKLVEEASRPEVKAALHENTRRAVEVGVPGAPTFRTEEGLFWGQDRLLLMAELQRHTAWT